MKKLLLICCGFLLASMAQAQGMKDPSTWTITAVPESGVYKLVFHVQLKAGWHIWALDPGGDGTLIPPSFTFTKGSYDTVGTITEAGKLNVIAAEGIEGKVRYYEGVADFSQMVKAKRGQIVKGEYTYQLCNESICLPPKTLPFSVRIP